MSIVVEVMTPRDSISYNNDQSEMNHGLESIATKRCLLKDMGLECIGTLIFVYVSLAGVNQAMLTNGSQLEIAACFTLGLASAVFIANKSGAHLNPAVSFTMWMVDSEFSFRRFVLYTLSQLTGGILAGLLVLSVYSEWIDQLSTSDSFIGSYGTLKNPNMSLFRSVVDQFIGSTLLMFAIQMSMESYVQPIIIGLSLGALGLFQGTNGFAFNLARDLGPRIASTIIFGTDAFTAMDHWFWVPIVVPFVGIPFGWALAQLLNILRY